MLINKIKKAFSFFLSLIQRETAAELVILPKSVRLAIAENDSILSKEEVLALLDPKFGLLWVWLTLKFYEDNKIVFFEIMERVLDDFSNNKSATIWEYLRNKITSSWSEKLLKTSGKISFISRMGFVEFCDALGKLYNEHEWFSSVILVANSWLMWLQTILSKLKKDKNELIILFPKLSTESRFYLVSFKTGELSTRFLTEKESNEIFKKWNLLVIDDISSTWKTEQQVNEILTPLWPEKIEFRTLIKFPKDRSIAGRKE